MVEKASSTACLFLTVKAGRPSTLLRTAVRIHAVPQVFQKLFEREDGDSSDLSCFRDYPLFSRVFDLLCFRDHVLRGMGQGAWGKE